MNASFERYNGIAIGLHWLIAALIIVMLGMGEYMTSLEASDSLRYLLTQWHLLTRCCTC